VEPEETYIARQRLGKHVPAAMDTQEKIEELKSIIFWDMILFITTTVKTSNPK
jgi:hypothetical protein